jgi:exonuclease SbcD
LSSKVFDPEIAYVALGHLHKAQRVAKTTHIRYSGSPLPMSFAEMDYRHQILCVELVGDKLSSVTEIPVPRRVELLRVPRQPAPLAEVLAMLASLQVDADLPLGEQPYLQVRVLLDAPEPGLRSQIEAALEGKAVRLAKIESTSKAQASGELVAVTLDDLQQLQPDEIFSRLYQQKFSQAVPDNLLAAFVQLQQAQLNSNVQVNA